MPTKAQLIFDLSQESAKKLSNYKNWTAFLKTAAHHYKYSFSDQLLIYSQRPDATACAALEQWNKMHRWVNKGSKGIALLRENGGRYGVKYVFDISDTNDFYNREVPIWKYDESYDDAIIETLENTFGKLKADTTIADAVICAAHNAIQDNKQDYLHELKFFVKDSLLEDLDDLNIEKEFCSVAEVSAAYMIMQRLGLQPDDTFGFYEFEHIQDFNTPETIGIIGNAVSTVSETALRSISETIRVEIRQKKFAQRREIIYNNVENNIRSNESERNENNDRTELQDDGRLSSAGIGSTADGSTFGQIRNAEEDTSETASSGSLHSTDDVGQTSKTLGGGGQESVGAGTDDSITDGTGGGSYRRTESAKSDRMDRNDEQFPAFSGRNSAEGTGVQLSFFDEGFPTEEEQKNMITEKTEQNKSSVFLMPQQVIDEMLASGANESNTILEICVQYSKNKSQKSNIEFLKNHYGTGGRGFIFDNKKVSAWWNENGMRIAYGNTAVNKGQLLSWEQVDMRINQLLESGRYAPQETLDNISGYEYKKTAEAFWFMHQDVNFEGDITYYEDMPDEVKARIEHQAEIEKAEYAKQSA